MTEMGKKIKNLESYVQFLFYLRFYFFWREHGGGEEGAEGKEDGGKTLPSYSWGWEPHPGLDTMTLRSLS